MSEGHKITQINFFWLAVAAVIIGMMHYGYSCADCGFYPPTHQEVTK